MPTPTTLRQSRLPDMLKALGMHLVMKVGGASGPLFGTLFMALAKDMPADPSLAEAGAAFGQAIEAVKARGKSQHRPKDHARCSRAFAGRIRPCRRR